MKKRLCILALSFLAAGSIFGRMGWASPLNLAHTILKAWLYGH